MIIFQTINTKYHAPIRFGSEIANQNHISLHYPADTFVKSKTSSDSDFQCFTKELSLYNIKTKTNEDCLLINSVNSYGGCLRIIKNNPRQIQAFIGILKKEPDISKKFTDNCFTFSDKYLDEISQKHPEIKDIVKELFIAEAAYSKFTHPAGIKKLEELGYRKTNPDKDIICIQNYIVYKNEYKNAGRNIVIPLFKNVLQNNPNIVIKAQAFGENPKSPINLYLRYGFIPLDKKVEEIYGSKVKTDKGMRINPQTTTIMYLPKDAALLKFITKI